MRPGKKIGLGVLGFFAVVVMLGCVLPRTFFVERSLVISAKVDEAYALAADLKNHPRWNARKLRDPSMQFSFPGEIHSGMGAVYAWTSEKSGAGRCTISAATRGESLTILVHLEGKGDGTAIWRFASEGNSTRVTRRFEGEIPIPVLGSLILLAAGPQDKLGADFEQELEVFRKIAEGAVSKQ